MEFTTMVNGTFYCFAIISHLATLVDVVPGVFFGLPLLALASFVFAATHHEDDEAITLATIHWAVWIGGVLGLILAIVFLIGLF